MSMKIYTYADMENIFEQEMNETHEPTIIMGMTYLAGNILRQIDPVAFRCLMADWLDYQVNEEEYYTELPDGTYTDDPEIETDEVA